MKNKKVLVFGATGLLGEPVAKSLQKTGFSVKIFARSEKKFSEKYDIHFELAKGDVLNKPDVEKAMQGCQYVYISLAKTDEERAVRNIVDAAKTHKIELISLVSGSTVSKENTWFSMIESKYEAEQLVMKSGIRYIIFRPSWFFDTLPMMIRNGKAMVIGNQQKPFHWMAAADFAKLVTNALLDKKIANKVFYCFGPETYNLHEAMEKYVQLAHPGIKKVSVTPLWLMKLIAALSGKDLLKFFTRMMDYFSKTDELGDASETHKLLGKPELTMEDWVKLSE